MDVDISAVSQRCAVVGCVARRVSAAWIVWIAVSRGVKEHGGIIGGCGYGGILGGVQDNGSKAMLIPLFSYSSSIVTAQFDIGGENVSISIFVCGGFGS